MQINNKYYHLLKIILIGDEKTGKSSLTQKFTDDLFNEKYDATIGVKKFSNPFQIQI